MRKARLRSPLLEVRASDWEGGACLIECAGEIDIETAPRLRAALNEALRNGAHRLVLDLGSVTFIDSVGIGHIVGAYKQLGPEGRLQVCTDNQHIRMLLEIAGLNGIFSMHWSVEEALRRQ